MACEQSESVFSFHPDCKCANWCDQLTTGRNQCFIKRLVISVVSFLEWFIMSDVLLVIHDIHVHWASTKYLSLCKAFLLCTCNTIRAKSVIGMDSVITKKSKVFICRIIRVWLVSGLSTVSVCNIIDYEFIRYNDNLRLVKIHFID